MGSYDHRCLPLKVTGREVNKVTRSPHLEEDPGFISAPFPALVRLTTPLPRKLPPDRAILPYSHFWYYLPQKDLE